MLVLYDSDADLIGVGRAERYGSDRVRSRHLRGVFGTFRNPVAHAPRTEWEISEADALDLSMFCGSSIDDSMSL